MTALHGKTGLRIAKSLRGGLFAVALAALSASPLSTGLFLALATGPARAQEIVDVELVLAADGSGSIDADEFRIQREGYASAITDPEVLSAMLGGAYGTVALSYVEWGGPTSQHTIVDWMAIRGPQDAAAFAAKLRSAPRIAQGYNSISGAIDHGVGLIRSNAYEGLTKIIDISGDGPQIGGRPLSLAREEAVALDITINALVVKRPGGGYPGPRGEPLETHYRNDVIGGLAPFVIVADETLSFAAAIRRKLILEIAGPTHAAPHRLAAGSNEAGD